jgi:hypothetical protein
LAFAIALGTAGAATGATTAATGATAGEARAARMVDISRFKALGFEVHRLIIEKN